MDVLVPYNSVCHTECRANYLSGDRPVHASCDVIDPTHSCFLAPSVHEPCRHISSSVVVWMSLF